MNLNIEIHTDDEQLSSLCSQYWEMSSDGDFVHKTTDMIKQYGIRNAHKLREIVNANSTAYSSNNACYVSGNPNHYNLAQIISSHKSGNAMNVSQQKSWQRNKDALKQSNVILRKLRDFVTNFTAYIIRDAQPE